MKRLDVSLRWSPTHVHRAARSPIQIDGSTSSSIPLFATRASKILDVVNHAAGQWMRIARDAGVLVASARDIAKHVRPL